MKLPGSVLRLPFLRLALASTALALLGGCALLAPTKPAFDPFELVKKPGIYGSCGKASCTPIVGANVVAEITLKGELPKPPRGLLICPISQSEVRCDASGTCTVTCKTTWVLD